MDFIKLNTKKLEGYYVVKLKGSTILTPSFVPLDIIFVPNINHHHVQYWRSCIIVLYNADMKVMFDYLHPREYSSTVY